MPKESPHKRFLHITWVEVGDAAFHLVARCELCDVVAEVSVDQCREPESVLDVIGIETLAARGCSHVNEVAGSGVRRAMKRRT